MKQIKKALAEDFYGALKYILEQNLAVNLMLEQKIVDEGLEQGNLQLSTELKNLRKDSFDKLKMLEKIQKGQKVNKDENDIAQMILGNDNE